MFEILLSILFTLFAVLAWRDLKLALTLLFGLLPTYLLRFSISPFPTTALEILILLSAATWFLRYKGYKKEHWVIGPYARPLLLLLAAASFGVVIAPDSINAFGIWKAYFVEPALVFIMIRSTFTTRADWIRALKVLGLSAMILSVYAFFQFGTGTGIPEPWDIEKRVTSVFDFPNALGLYLAPIVGMSIVLGAKTRERFFWGTVALVSVTAIVLAKTEAALVAIPATVIITVLISDAKKKTKQRITTELIILTTVFLIISPAARTKILLQDLSGRVRLSQWHETFAFLKEHLFFGAGLNAYPEAIAPFHNPILFEIFQYPHNIFLNIWVELGILGLIAFFWIAIESFRTIRKHKHDTLKLAAFAALLIMVIHGLVDVPYFKNDLSVMTWIFMAILTLTPAQKKS